MSENCPLCALPAGQILWQDELVCVINPGENRIPGFTRVVLKKHIAEMSALSEKERIHVMNAVNAVETLMLRMMRPDKVNLASLGNMVPHLHWHVIPRWKNDPWFGRPHAAATMPPTPKPGNFWQSSFSRHCPGPSTPPFSSSF